MPRIRIGRGRHTGIRLIFSGTNAQGTATWITDGTPAGTVLLKQNLRAWGPAGAEALGNSFVVTGATAYFVASVDETGLQLWATDGTSQGTRRVFAYPTPISGFTLAIHGVLNGRIVFFRDGQRQLAAPVHHRRHDGRDDGLAPTPGAYVSVDAVYVGAARIWFAALNDLTIANGRGIWISDGTPQSTHQAVNSLGNTSTGLDAVSAPQSFQPLAGGGVLYASAYRLWMVDGTDTIVSVTAAMGIPGSGPPRLINNQIVSVGSRNLMLAGVRQPRHRPVGERRDDARHAQGDVGLRAGCDQRRAHRLAPLHARQQGALFR